ncbi:hypothetical protein BH24ACT4_BH24ACT4_17350 [soil metagenome]
MNVKLVAAVVAVAKDQEVNVSRVCATEATSRKTFYKWVKRFKEEGLEGLEDRSTRPKTSPGQIAAEVEDEIVRLRKKLADDGLDHGATTIQWHLGRSRAMAGRVPSVAGVHRVLVRRGQVVPQPAKRPKSSWNRFEAAAPNERWQIDAMDWVIVTGVVRVFNIIDDHSRVTIRSQAVPEATTEAAWATFIQGVAAWGPPAGVLSDNGLCFSGKLRGFEVLFEANLRDAGIHPRTGRPYHPQTTGKVERFQQTLKKWLRRQRLARDLAELQAQLDAFAPSTTTSDPTKASAQRSPPTAGTPRSQPDPQTAPWPTRTYHTPLRAPGQNQRHRPR